MIEYRVPFFGEQNSDKGLRSSSTASWLYPPVMSSQPTTLPHCSRTVEPQQVLKTTQYMVDVWGKYREKLECRSVRF